MPLKSVPFAPRGRRPLSARVRPALLCLTAAALCACGPAQDAVVPPPEEPEDHACSYYYFLRGREAELDMDFEAALEAYENAVICDEGASYARSKIPILLLRLDRADEAALRLHEFLRKNPDDVRQRLLYATILLGQGRTEQALQQYRHLLSRHPDNPEVTLPLAELYLAGGQAQEARKILERTLSRNDDSYQAHLLMARLLRDGGDAKKARAHFDRALAINWSAEIQAEEAELLARQEDFAAAEALYRDIIAREDQHEGASVGLIRLLLKQGKEDEVLAELLRLKRRPDKPAWVDPSIARLHIRRGENDEARRLLEQIIKLENSSEARYLLAALLQHEKKYEEALSQVRLIDNKSPEYPEALGLMVGLHRALNRVDDAALFLERNIAGAITRHPAMYPLLAALHHEQGRNAMARRTLEAGMAEYPDDEDLLYAYAAFLEERGEHVSAVARMEELVARNPFHAAALNFVGFSWADDNTRLDQALAYIERARRLRPDNGYIRDSLGWVYFRLGRLKEAERELEQAVRETDEDPAVLEHLAQVCQALGKRDRALALYKKLLALYDGDDDEAARRRVRERLEQLEPSRKKSVKP